MIDLRNQYVRHESNAKIVNRRFLPHVIHDVIYGQICNFVYLYLHNYKYQNNVNNVVLSLQWYYNLYRFLNWFIIIGSKFFFDSI